jgi:hypothetical protein
MITFVENSQMSMVEFEKVVKPVSISSCSIGACEVMLRGSENVSYSPVWWYTSLVLNEHLPKIRPTAKHYHTNARCVIKSAVQLVVPPS